MRLEVSLDSCFRVESSPEVVAASAVIMLVALALAEEYDDAKDNEDSASVSRTYESEKTTSYYRRQSFYTNLRIRILCTCFRRGPENSLEERQTGLR